MNHTSFGRIFALAGALSVFGPSVAAADVVFTPTTIPGVSFVGYGDPGFPAALQSAMPSEAKQASVAPVLPLGAIVTNTGPRSIVFLAVHFDYVDPATVKVTTGDTSIDGSMRPPTSWIKPGEANFFAGVMGWPSLTAKIPNPAAASSIGTWMQRYAADSVTVSLDAVAFDDGEFDGPDVAKHYCNSPSHGRPGRICSASFV